MKKLVLLIFVFTLMLGCSKDDPSTPEPDSTTVNDSNDSTNDNPDDSTDDSPDDSTDDTPDDTTDDNPDDTTNDDPVDSIVYVISGLGESDITGEATFDRNEDNSTTVYIELINASSEIHPTSINFNSVEEGGEKAITLNACECAVSTTIVATMDDGSPINYDELIDFDGHLNIYESEVLDDVIIAQSNIGSNSN